MAGVILYVLHFTVCSEKDAFEEGEQEISDIGTVPAQSEPRRHTGLSIGPFHLKRVYTPLWMTELFAQSLDTPRTDSSLWRIMENLLKFTIENTEISYHVNKKSSMGGTLIKWNSPL